MSRTTNSKSNSGMTPTSETISCATGCTCVGVEDFIHFVTQHCSCSWIFRGQACSDWDLIPKVDRLEFEGARNSKGRLGLEQAILKEFKLLAQPHLSYFPRSDWEWLAHAQHYRLPTRLLDWTFKPLAALYFAVEERGHDNWDSIVFCYNHGNKHFQPDSSPFVVEAIEHFTPPHINTRITSQGGCFTVHPHDRKINPGKLVRIEIPKKNRNKIRETLFMLGIHHASIFPDLEGIAEHISKLESRYYTAKPVQPLSASSINTDIVSAQGDHGNGTGGSPRVEPTNQRP
ncbi:MAG TPA: FRG domain-containing protein [Thermoanaerobaculia bacterium]|nr:FRG domain-containing protein [Thermoanaerobaculia bacterium]